MGEGSGREVRGREKREGEGWMGRKEGTGVEGGGEIKGIEGPQ